MKHRNLIGAVALGLIATGPLAHAQSGFFVTPSLGVTSIYDDNLFFSFDNERQDVAARISPGLEVGYETPATNILTRYTFDAEYYDKFTELDSSNMRQFADIEANHQISRRVQLEGDVHYTKTNTPADLAIATGGPLQGLLLGRMEAQRIAVQPAVIVQLSARSEARVEYGYTSDELPGTIQNTTNLFATEFTHQITAPTRLDVGYIYRQYDFERPATEALPVAVANTQDSHTPWVGVRHDLSDRLQFTGRAGPRIYDDETRPYVQLSLRRTHTGGDLILNYEHNETTLLGELGRHEAETYSAAFTHTIGQNFEIRITPAFGKLSQPNFAVDLYRAEMLARYRLTPYLFLTASLNMYYQEVEFASGAVDEVSRNIAMVGFQLMLPRREARARP